MYKLFSRTPLRIRNKPFGLVFAQEKYRYEEEDRKNLHTKICQENENKLDYML